MKNNCQKKKYKEREKILKSKKLDKIIERIDKQKYNVTR